MPLRKYSSLLIYSVYFEALDTLQTLFTLYTSFFKVLMRSFQKEWERKTIFMKDSILFRGWTLKEVRAASATSTIKEFVNNKVSSKRSKDAARIPRRGE